MTNEPEQNERYAGYASLIALSAARLGELDEDAFMEFWPHLGAFLRAVLPKTIQPPTPSPTVHQ